MPSATPAEPIGLLHAELRGAEEPAVAARVRGQEREHGHLVDHERELVGPRPASARIPSHGADPKLAHGLAELLVIDAGLGPDTHAPHHLEEVHAARVEAHARDRQLASP